MEPQFAAFDWEMIPAFALSFALFVGVPLTWMLLSHQRKMAELIHGRSGDPELRERVARLEGEVSDLRRQANSQAIRMDDHEQALAERAREPQLPQG